MTIFVNSLPACRCGRIPAHAQAGDGSCSLPAPVPAHRKVLGWFAPRHIRAVTGEGTITLQCEHGHAEGIPERRLDGPRFADPHIGAFLRAHAHGAAIRSYRP
jgi:hypothetical protein